jgi:hypothetical protein
MRPPKLPSFKTIMYVDTVHLRLTKSVDIKTKQKIRNLGCPCGEKYVPMSFRPEYKYLLRINQITPNKARQIENLLKPHDYMLNRVDITLDVIPEKPDDLSVLRDFVDNYLYDVGSRKISIPSGKNQGTIYSNRIGDRKNFTYYSDQPCRMLSPNQPCLHLESRFKGRQSIRTYLKIETLEELQGFNYDRFWNEQLKFGILKQEGLHEKIQKGWGVTDQETFKKVFKIWQRVYQHAGGEPPETLLNLFHIIKSGFRKNNCPFQVDNFVRRIPNPFVSKRVKLWNFISDEEWEIFEICCPNFRKDHNARETMNKFIGAAQYGWDELKKYTSDGQNVYNKVYYWKKQGVFLKINKAGLFHKLKCFSHVPLGFAIGD